MQNTNPVKDLTQGNLGKWPQMLVTGVPVTSEQAQEIIFLTDHFLTDASEYSGGNCHEFNRYYREISGLDQLRVERQHPDGHFVDTDWDRMYQLRNSLGVVHTQYVHNDWASCSFVGGPHGWCHPDGTISYSDNVGKWPSIDEVLDDWIGIAHAFPYLDLHVTLMSSDDDADVPVVPVINIRVVNGTASPETPDISVHAGLSAPSTQSQVEAFIARMKSGSTTDELGLPDSWYEIFANRVREAIARL